MMVNALAKATSKLIRRTTELAMNVRMAFLVSVKPMALVVTTVNVMLGALKLPIEMKCLFAIKKMANVNVETVSKVKNFTKPFVLKFIYSEKATKFFKIFSLLLSYVVPFKSKVKISQNLVAFSKYMNFNNLTILDI